MQDRAVFRGMTQVELDAQYDQRTAVPAMRDYMERWSAAGRVARSMLAPETHAYGAGRDARLDLYAPARPRSAHLHIHGGAWRALSGEDAAFTVAGLMKGGAVVAIADFPLAPAAGLDTIVAHVREAFLWLRDWARPRNLPVTVSGHSSGAHLAACLLHRRWWAQSGVSADDFKGVLLASGVYDLEPVRLSARNDYLNLGPEDVLELSPISNLPARLPPLAILWGELELREFRRQSRAFADKIRPIAERKVAREITGLNHFEVYDAFGDPASECCRELQLFS